MDGAVERAEGDGGQSKGRGLPIGRMRCRLCSAARDEDGKQNLKILRAQSFVPEQVGQRQSTSGLRLHVTCSRPQVRHGENTLESQTVVENWNVDTPIQVQQTQFGLPSVYSACQPSPSCISSALCTLRRLQSILVHSFALMRRVRLFLDLSMLVCISNALVPSVPPL